MNVRNREIVKAVFYLLENYQCGPLSIQDVADRMGYSSHYLQRIFRQATGRTLGSDIRTLRLWRAAEALSESQGKVGCISHEFGFSSHHGFTRAFIRYFQMSPARWRAMQRTSEERPDVTRLQITTKLYPH